MPLIVRISLLENNSATGSTLRSHEQSMEHKDATSGVRRKFSWGGFNQWHRVVICIWCALIVTSQSGVIFLFPNQRFGEVC